jgi:hypothetical protein
VDSKPESPSRAQSLFSGGARLVLFHPTVHREIPLNHFRKTQTNILTKNEYIQKSDELQRALFQGTFQATTSGCGLPCGSLSIGPDEAL